ncbi:bifunctional 1-(5-phosphoribosyl)-5-((5-phosphoribosylamino)methylideneamino)imidazole-4-carboxamide isomerase/phosphoribosylanthranilate isomerase PriA [Corynebacterium sp. zg-331]|uniref:bifunctional 1-(5-phosphoribosyl)-5-((5- phosphoribosylamino)methylideneamino)imidazole-4- carboxamide isomerase/phosphoribosylanthranilate isomerase PriA n=1 Tax=unclassified Corynebacterium TaxID=2624378 RepID=UPI00128CA582|nr:MULTISPECIES: bifunctional 1-(5-phosphoribosyl)-5-((5-phosphoribosylamino)methylideneamino)imidazole-4-carboxamide isomerase/phosphoribosylanthranilate isomerase PriA [unclassified Corynebacterium]MBC3185268.1 bifunctional 1-(5-phosphoribosyl)-5-((5-phosphoribosylamino)methylideneamino)imidazole-4-carboxamide isomerase/phosphoribosylanthranilate isomerase PriA [Corynebacterium sp. zg-331]MPV51765.1 bifunctional 1-(5-phosphoribosyl)-5-((5-phosphoribosylamino)methylideneamino)imidazole-4-carboxa
MSLTLLPAVDISDGKAVRLHQGEAGTEKSYGSPLEAALVWQEQGARWVHLVDIDAAFGRGSNHEIIAEIAGTLDISVDVAGGIRDDASLDQALATGASRINIGTAAIEKPEWIARVLERHGDLVAIDLAAHESEGQWRAKTWGWAADAGDLWEVLERLDAAGCQRLVVTDVSRDGTLTGPNVDLLRDVAAATDAAVTASGGIATVEDIAALSRVSGEGIDSAIVGKALYEGSLSLREALAVLAH